MNSNNTEESKYFTFNKNIKNQKVDKLFKMIYLIV